jgi:hypothetical protein
VVRLATSCSHRDVSGRCAMHVVFAGDGSPVGFRQPSTRTGSSARTRRRPWTDADHNGMIPGNRLVTGSPASCGCSDRRTGSADARRRSDGRYSRSAPHRLAVGIDIERRLRRQRSDRLLQNGPGHDGATTG